MGLLYSEEGRQTLALLPRVSHVVHVLGDFLPLPYPCDSMVWSIDTRS